jgi:transcriptional regulator with XRE-family HTH domain
LRQALSTRASARDLETPINGPISLENLCSATQRRASRSRWVSNSILDVEGIEGLSITLELDHRVRPTRRLRCKNALRPLKAKPIVPHRHLCVERALNTPTGPDPIDVAVGTRIRVQRRHMKISQDELAQALGLTFQQVQKYERGANRVSASMLVRIAARLQTTVGSLVGEDVVAEQDVAMLTALSTPGAIDLLRAYGQATPKGRKTILTVAKTLVEPDETAGVA